MSTKASAILVGAVLVALILGATAGFLARANEQSTLLSELERTKESKAMLEEQLRAATVAVPLKAESGQMAHDVWLLIAPLRDGKYALVISAEGLEQNGAYIVEGVTRTSQMQTVPIASTATESEFLADQNGNGFYWITLDTDPRASFENVLLLFLPDMQMQNAVLVASTEL